MRRIEKLTIFRVERVMFYTIICFMFFRISNGKLAKKWQT